ncbi:MAG: hypothetical protein AAF696_20235 [Bacteroidota bacterium]
MAGLMISSCADEDLSPIITFDKAGKGGYVRLVELRSDIFDLTQAQSTAVDFDVEFIDLEDGALVNNYSINVEYVDNNPDNGDNSVATTPYLSFGRGDFGTSVNSKVGISVNISMSAVANELGLNIDDLQALDLFRFTASITLDDGQVFTAANSSAAVNGAAFQGFFNFDVNVTCPVPEDRFVGAYTLEYVGTPPTLFGGTPYGELPITVEMASVTGSQTRRTISGISALGELGIGQPTMVQTFDLLCTVTSGISSSTRLGCVDAISIAQGAQPFGAFNFDDDTELTLNLELDVTDDCGRGSQGFTVRLTKQ